MIISGTWQTLAGPAPWLPMDTDASLNFSFDLSAWIAAAGTALTLTNAEFIDHSALDVSAPTLAGAVVTTRIEWLPDADQRLGAFYPFTLRFTASDGQRDDRTFNLQFVER